MSKLLRNGVAALILFSVLTGLLLTAYSSLEDNYGIVDGDIKTIGSTTGNIADQFRELNLIEGVVEIQNGILEVRTAGGNLFDIAGALGTIGIGLTKVITGLLTAPYGIVAIIVTFYAGEIPGVLAGLVSMIVVYIGFILISAYLKKDV